MNQKCIKMQVILVVRLRIGRQIRSNCTGNLPEAEKTEDERKTRIELVARLKFEGKLSVAQLGKHHPGDEFKEA